jgi:hypothetical protein
MHNLTLALAGAWKVLAVGLVLGAGLPLIFALGIRSLAYGAGGTASVRRTDGSPARPHPVGGALGVLCFAVVLAAVALGITFVVASGFGKTLSFTHIYPTIS